jgi:hypothetical protein
LGDGGELDQTMLLGNEGVAVADIALDEAVHLTPQKYGYAGQAQRGECSRQYEAQTNNVKKVQAL